MLLEEKKIMKIKKQLFDLGAIHPGSINLQYNVCGKEGCSCKDKKNPVKHGPYNQLSYTIAGKSSSKFIKKEFLAEAQNQIKEYQKFKELNRELVNAYVSLAKKQGFKKGNY